MVAGDAREQGERSESFAIAQRELILRARIPSVLHPTFVTGERSMAGVVMLGIEEECSRETS
jgi:hypothetical protein